LRGSNPEFTSSKTLADAGGPRDYLNLRMFHKKERKTEKT
jgi:hypothetical protein